MHIRGETVISNYVAYFVLVALFFGISFYYIQSYHSSAKLWEGFYAAHVGHVLNNAIPGKTYWIDVTRASTIAHKSGVSLNDIFSFDNGANSITVRLSPASSTSYSFFNEVQVINWTVQQASGDSETDRLIVSIGVPT